MNGFYKYLIVLLLCSSQSLWAQIQFEASISRNSIPVNENVRVDFAMNSDGDHFAPPAFEGFRVVGGPNQSVSYTWTNGKKTFNKTYSYFLAPTRKGTLTIGSASIEIEGKTYQSKPLSVTVTDAVKKEDPRTAVNHSQEQVLDGIHLVAEVSNTNPFENEPITVVYKVYVERNSNLVGWNGKEIPTYKNFWVNAVEIKDLKVEKGKYNGVEAQYITFKKDILMPQESGDLELEALVMDIQAEVFTGRRDFFGFPETGYVTKTYTTGKRKIKVKPLPLADRPATFSGAVGKFDFKVTPSKTTLNAGETLQLTVEVSGRGNMNLFTLPTPEAPEALEVYDPEYTEKVTPGNYGLQGKKTDKYTIIPQYKGTYTIAPMAFTYFDLESKSYKTMVSDSIPISVVHGPEMATTVKTIEAGELKQTSFQDIAAIAVFLPTNKQDYWKSLRFYILSLLPFLAMPFLVFIVQKRRRKAGDFEGLRLKRNNRLAKKYLGEAKKNLKNKTLFYEALERCLHNFLKAKLSIETTEMSNDHIEELLRKKGIQNEEISAFFELKKACEYARYAPTTQENMNRDFDMALDIIARLEKQFN